MKIAVWYNLPGGGAKRALFYHVRGLAARGHHVEVWRPPIKEGKDLWPLAGLVAAEHVLPLDWREGRFQKFIENDPILSEARRGDDLRYVRALDRHCRLAADEINASGFDVLFANTSVVQSVAPVGRYVRGPRVLYLQEPHRGMFEAGGPEGLNWIALPPRRFGWLRPRYAAWRVAKSWGVGQLRALARAETDNAASYDRILVNSYFSRESVLRAFGLDARVCYLGVDTELFRDWGREREQLVVGVGEIKRHKNVALVIEAVGRLPEPRPRLLWLGNASLAEYLSRMTALAASLGVPFEARTGVGDAELVETLNRAALMAYAPRLEPFGFAPLEANACGAPVVAVAEGGVRETVVDGVNGLLVEHDPQAMAEAVARLLHDKAYARRLGQAGARLVRERWSVGASVERLERHLEEALSIARAARS